MNSKLALATLALAAVGCNTECPRSSIRRGAECVPMSELDGGTGRKRENGLATDASADGSQDAGSDAGPELTDAGMAKAKPATQIGRARAGSGGERAARPEMSANNASAAGAKENAEAGEQSPPPISGDDRTPSPSESPFDVVTWGPDRFDIFARLADNSMGIKSLLGMEWVPSSIMFNDLGGPHAGTISVVSWAKDRIDIFANKSDGVLCVKTWDLDKWLPSQFDCDNLGAPAKDVAVGGRTAASSWAANEIDLVVPGADKNLYHKRWNGAWTPSQTSYELLGGPVASDPATASWGPDRLDIFAALSDGTLGIKSWTGSAWEPADKGFANLGAPTGAKVIGTPAVVAWAANHLDIFVTASDDNVYHKIWNDNAWSPSQESFATVGSPPSGLTGSPKVVSWAADALHLFVRGKDGNLYFKAWANGWVPSQTGWVSLGAPSNTKLRADPSIITWGKDRLDVFAVGEDNALYYKYWQTDHWTPSELDWTSLRGELGM